ncbi:MAG: hypothetical protein K0Q90_1963 [Paenibacillaceae bacterium]|jgi:hypothetical protein|nr:hypothetical protein [Paenibacillaceae bacterium]
MASRDAVDNGDEFKRKLLLVVGIVVILSFLYGYGKPGGSTETVIPAG